MLIVLSEFTLRINVLEELGSLPPLLVGLDQHGIRLDLLNEFLGSLGKHSRLVTGTNEEHFLAIESLGQMDEG